MKPPLDIDRYPLHRLDTHAGRALVERCRNELAAGGACMLPGFLPAEVVARSRRNALNCRARAHQVDHAFAYDDVYPNAGTIALDSLPAHHPRHTTSLTRIKFVAKDLIPEDDPVLALHGWPAMTEFIARVMGLAITYPSPCPLSGCVFTIADRDELQDWHFDSNDFIVTLMLQASDAGGEFEYVPGLRAPDGDDDFDGVRAVFDGSHPRRVRLPLAPATLTLFKGRFNFHRAAPVAGERSRVMAILSYDQDLNHVSPPNYLELFYGRTRPLAR